MFFDSTGNNEIEIGYRVKFRGEVYTIAKFLPGQGLYKTAGIEFKEEQHVDELADEISVDFVSKG